MFKNRTDQTDSRSTVKQRAKKAQTHIYNKLPGTDKQTDKQDTQTSRRRHRGAQSMDKSAAVSNAYPGYEGIWDKSIRN